MLKVGFIAFILVLGSYIFSNDIHYYVTIPLDKVMTRLQIYLTNTDALNDEIDVDSVGKDDDIKIAYKKALLLLDKNKKVGDDIIERKMETHTIDTNIKHLIHLVSISIGKQFLNLVPQQNLSQILSLNLKSAGVKMNSAYIIMKITHTDEFIGNFKEKAQKILNKIYSIYHSMGITYFCDLDNCRDLLVWKENRKLISNKFKLYVGSLCPDINIHINEDQNKIKENEFDFSKNTIINLCFLCANKIMHTLFHKLPSTMNKLKKYGVRINFLLNYGELINGYVGNNLKINEIYTSSSLRESELTIIRLNQDYNVPSIFIHENFYNQIDKKLLDYFYIIELIKFSMRIPPENKLVRIFKQFIDLPIKENADKILIDNKIYIKTEKIINKRKELKNKINESPDRLLDMILSDKNFDKFTVENVPSIIIANLNLLFDYFKIQKLNEAMVTLRRIKKGGDLKNLKDDCIKSKLKVLESIIRNKINRSSRKPSKPEDYNTIEIDSV